MVDHSKWKNIEMSDNEDETHLNIDTLSLFRFSHQARVRRMEDIKREQQKLQIKKTFQEKFEQNKKELEEALSALSTLSVEEQELKKLEKEFKCKEKIKFKNLKRKNKEKKEKRRKYKLMLAIMFIFIPIHVLCILSAVVNKVRTIYIHGVS